MECLILIMISVFVLIVLLDSVATHERDKWEAKEGEEK